VASASSQGIRRHAPRSLSVSRGGRLPGRSCGDVKRIDSFIYCYYCAHHLMPARLACRSSPSPAPIICCIARCTANALTRRISYLHRHSPPLTLSFNGAFTARRAFAYSRILCLRISISAAACFHGWVGVSSASLAASLSPPLCLFVGLLSGCVLLRALLAHFHCTLFAPALHRYYYIFAFSAIATTGGGRK